MSFVTGQPKILLRLEGLCILLISLLFYSTSGFSWSLFGWLCLVPDIALLGYLFNPRVGSVAYNITHSLLIPLGLAAVGVILGVSLALSLATIWIAHIGFDRALGYGLKYGSGFTHTHLGRIGRDRYSEEM
ncbi:DUF4260 domain-containing protein [Vibrio fluvialis]|uniref:DUF4260 domain-containing protein n=1 Tax=Vibrio fluvialis TaxID=676 RepID=UPI001F413A72|nr:DUF4260 domain-containing protein [Vibrio fluvialis]ELI5732501.1 DUF4260 domain-containing protein [Vibrio fluvialis]MCE7613523.1 DUF4260 domain-containing protein [Vibrio fluvialis]